MIPLENDIKNFIKNQSNKINFDSCLGKAICKTESNFVHYLPDGSVLKGKYNNGDIGCFQVNKKVWSKHYTKYNLDSWTDNIIVGLDIANNMCKLAIKKNADNIPQATYSAYNAGEQNMFRYKTGNDIRDKNFLKNYKTVCGN